jgi:MoaA/NifB/PqqE/SkfB family radical SAM enzyme
MVGLRQKVNLLRGLRSGDTARGGPIYVSVDVTRRCNLRCVGCRFHSASASLPPAGDRSVRDIDLGLFRGLCSELQPLGTTSLLLLGEGEPLLHPSISEMIRVAKRSGFFVTLFTNGTLLDRERVEALFESGLDNLQISLWASSREEYALCYPGTELETFDRVVDNVRRFVARRQASGRRFPRVDLHSTLNRFNARSVHALADLAKGTGCDGLSLWPLRTVRGQLDHMAVDGGDQRELLGSLAGLRRRLDDLSLDHNVAQLESSYLVGREVWKKYPCYIGWVHSKVRPDGTVVPCSDCDLPLGTLGEATFSEIWNGAPYRQFRRLTRTRAGLASMGGPCDCAFCCHLENNARVHRFARWLAG